MVWCVSRRSRRINLVFEQSVLLFCVLNFLGCTQKQSSSVSLDQAVLDDVTLTFIAKKLLMFAFRKSCSYSNPRCFLSEGTGTRVLSARLLGGEADERSARTVLGLKQGVEKGLLCFWELQG